MIKKTFSKTYRAAQPLFWGVLFVLPFLFTSPAFAGNISSCQTLSSAGTYTLTSDVGSANQTCFNITSTGVVITSGSTHSISGNVIAAGTIPVDISGGVVIGATGKIIASSSVLFDSNSSGANYGTIISASSTSFDHNSNNTNIVISPYVSFIGNTENLGTVIASTTFLGGNSNNDGGTINASSTTIGGTEAYNLGTINGNVTITGTRFSNPAPSGGVFNINLNNWTGTINGTVYGSDGVPITTYDFSGGRVNYANFTVPTAIFNSSSFNSGSVTITASSTIFNDGSYNNGTIITSSSTIFNGNSYSGGVINSSSTIFNGSAHFSGNITGPIVLNTTYYSGSVPTGGVFNVNSQSLYGIIHGTLYDSNGSLITSVVFSGGQANYGNFTASSTTFNGSSYNNSGSVVIASSTFFKGNSNNGGTVTSSSTTFTDNSYDVGIINGRVYVYPPVNVPLNGTINGTVIYDPNYSSGGILYFSDKNTNDGDWNDTANWWLNPNHTSAAGRIPTANDTVYVSGTLSTNGGPDAVAGQITFVGADNKISITVPAALFTVSSYNDGTINGNAYFERWSNNQYDGTVSGDGVFFQYCVNETGGSVGTEADIPLLSADVFTNALGNGDWNSAGNWLSVTVPNATDDVVILTSITLPGDVTNNIYIGAAGVTLSGGGHTLTGNVTGVSGSNASGYDNNDNGYSGSPGVGMVLSNITVTGNISAGAGGSGSDSGYQLGFGGSGAAGGSVTITNSTIDGSITGGTGGSGGYGDYGWGGTGGNGGSGGSVTITNSTTSSAYAGGGGAAGGPGGTGGTGGNVSISGTALDLSNKTISAGNYGNGGNDGCGGNCGGNGSNGTIGTVTVTFTDTLAIANTVLSPISVLTVNAPGHTYVLNNFPGGNFPFLPNTSPASCGTFAFSGSYTLSPSGTFTSNGTCFTITTDNVTIDGGSAHPTITGSVSGSGNNDPGDGSGGTRGRNFVLENMTVTGGIYSTGGNGGDSLNANICSSSGGTGGSITIATSTVGTIHTTGGNGGGDSYCNGVGKAGSNGGAVTVTNSTISSGNIESNGGNGGSGSQAGGSGGTGGPVSLNSSTVYGNIHTFGGIGGQGQYYTGNYSIGGDGGRIDLVISAADALTADGGQGFGDGGNGGAIDLVSATSSTISTVGGSSSECGYGGNGGTVTATVDSSYGSISNAAGSDGDTSCSSKGSGSSGGGPIVTDAPPVLVMNGATSISLTVGQSFVDPGATAYDYESGNPITVVTSGTVNTGHAGTYYITYSATNSIGTSMKTRTVTVNPIPPVYCYDHSATNYGSIGSCTYSTPPASNRTQPSSGGGTGYTTNPYPGSKPLSSLPTFTLPINPIGVLNLKPLPTFGTTTSKTSLTFSFAPLISPFVFSPLPKEIASVLKKAAKLESFLASAGLTSEQSYAALTIDPLLLPVATSTTPGLFAVTSSPNDTPLYIYVASDKMYPLEEMVSAKPEADLTITLAPVGKGEVVGTFQGEAVIFNLNRSRTEATVDITTPSIPGRYYLVTPFSPLPLAIVVSAPSSISPQVPVSPKKSFDLFQWIRSFF